MKTITIRLPDVEAAMLYELQKYDKKYCSLASMLGGVIANDYRALRGDGRGR